MEVSKRRQALTRNLMGVNKEKEPLSGTPPERWLFDRSLHFKMQELEHMIVAMNNYLSRETKGYQISTYNT